MCTEEQNTKQKATRTRQKEKGRKKIEAHIIRLRGLILQAQACLFFFLVCVQWRNYEEMQGQMIEEEPKKQESEVEMNDEHNTRR